MNGTPCPVCKAPLDFRIAQSRKARQPKTFLMIICPADGRHFRGFVQDREYVRRVVEAMETGNPKPPAGED